MRAVILAGGLGTRLKPYTTSLPKPLMPINGEFPIIEIILRQLKRYNFKHVTLAVGHLSEIIHAFVGDGSRWGMKIDLSREVRPLSTIGPLTLLSDLPERFLVMNGDILTTLDFSKLIRFHDDKSADVTVAVARRTVTVDYGVVKFERRRIKEFVEKPSYEINVSMGIYVINRSLIRTLARGEPYGFDNLMIDGIRKEQHFVAYPFDDFWLDIGRPDDYELANEEFAKMRGKLLVDEA